MRDYKDYVNLSNADALERIKFVRASNGNKLTILAHYYALDEIVELIGRTFGAVVGLPSGTDGTVINFDSVPSKSRTSARRRSGRIPWRRTRSASVR